MKRALPAIAAAAAVAMAPVVRAETFYLGGTGTVGTPSAASMAYLISTGMIDDPHPIGLPYPAQLWPLVGDMTLDASVAQGTDTLDAAIHGATGPVTVVGVSQGAVVINDEKRRLMAEPAADRPADLVFVTVADPTNSDGGVMSKLPPVHIPLLDFTVTPPPVDTPYRTVEVVREYDGVSDFPDRPLPLAVANAVVGGFTLHPNYGGIDIDDTANVVTYSDGGKTEHIVVPTEHLPLTQGLRDAGVDSKLVDAIDKPLRKRIDRAYDGPRPSKPAHAQRRNPIRAIAHALGERRDAARASKPD